MKNSLKNIHIDILIGLIILVLEFSVYFASKAFSTLSGIPLVLMSLLIINIIIFTVVLSFNKKYIRSFFIGLLIILLYYISQIAGAYVGVFNTGLLYALISTKEYSSSDLIVFYINNAFFFTILFSLTVVISVAIFNRKKIQKDIVDFISKWYINIPKVILYYILSYMLMIGVGIFTAIVFPDLSSQNVQSENQQFLEQSIANASLIIMFTMICISGPLIEELVFRHAIIKRVLGFVNKYVAAILATFLFIFVHLAGQDFTSFSEVIYLMLGYFPVAITVNLVYAFEENIIYSTLIHIMNNFVSFIFILLALYI